MALIGYARVSTNEQHLHLQQDAFSAAGCLKIYTDTISGVKSERKGLDGGEIDVVGRRDVLDAGREDDRVTHEGPLLMEHVAKGEDNAHSEGDRPPYSAGRVAVLPAYSSRLVPPRSRWGRPARTRRPPA
jgi:hypothetical protein